MDSWNASAVRFLLEAVRGAVIVIDDAGLIVQCNRAAARLLGLPAEEITGRDAHEVLASAEGSEVLDRALSGDAVSGALTGLTRHDGTAVPVSVEAAPLEQEIVVVLHDESERLETQAALADAQERLRDLQSLGDVGLWRWIPAEDEVQWTEQLYAIHDIDPLDFEGDLDSHVAPIREDDRDDVRRALRQTAVEGYPFEEEYVVVRRNGEERRVYSRADPVLDEDGAVVAVTGIVQDVTTERRVREEIEAANERLQRFARALAHDLRTPLVAVTGFAELLAEDDSIQGELETFAQRIKHNSEQALELLNALLSEARHRQRETATGDVDLEAVVEWVIDTLEEQIRRTGSTVSTGDLPRVRGHEPLLRQAVLNLVGNALKFGGADGGGATVRISAVEIDDLIELRVDDDGPGVPVEERGSIFDDGYRVQRDVERGIDGTGIGLATVREIADRHDTSVDVTDSDLGGARFVLRLHPVPEDTTSGSSDRGPGIGGNRADRSGV